MRSEHEIPEPRQFETVSINVEGAELTLPEAFAPDYGTDVGEAMEQGKDLLGGSWFPPTKVKTYIVRTRSEEDDGPITHVGIKRLV